MTFNLRRFRVVVAFKNEGETYGTETYIVLAKDEDQAERKALTNATGSQYDDDRIPGRRICISQVEETDEDCAEAA